MSTVSVTARSAWKANLVDGRPPVDSPPSTGRISPLSSRPASRWLTVERESPDRSMSCDPAQLVVVPEQAQQVAGVR